MNRIKAAIGFLTEQYDNSERLKADPFDRAYRYDHTMRVAALGARIAKAEGLNEEALVLACLLHDVSYAVEWNGEDHGILSARISKPFIESLGLKKSVCEEILHGISTHASGKSEYEFKDTPLTLSVGDCDNIDRFEVSRLIEVLEVTEFLQKPMNERLEYIEQTLAKLDSYLTCDFATKTATLLWREKIAYRADFMRRLRTQLASGVAFEQKVLSGE